MNNFLDFIVKDINAKKNRINHGYNDAKNLLEPIINLGINILESERKKEELSTKDKISFIFKKKKEKNNNCDAE